MGWLQYLHLIYILSRSVLSQFEKPTRHSKPRQFNPDKTLRVRKDVSKPAVTKWNKEHSPFSDGPRLGDNII